MSCLLGFLFAGFIISEVFNLHLISFRFIFNVCFTRGCFLFLWTKEHNVFYTTFQGHVLNFSLTWWSKKYQDWCLKQLISIPNNKLNGFFFKVISLESNALSHHFLPCLKALLEGFFWNTHQLHHYALLMATIPLKWILWIIPMNLSIRKKSYGARSNELGDNSSMEIFPGIAGFTECCEQVHCHVEALLSSWYNG